MPKFEVRESTTKVCNQEAAADALARLLLWYVEKKKQDSKNKPTG